MINKDKLGSFIWKIAGFMVEISCNLMMGVSALIALADHLETNGTD